MTADSPRLGNLIPDAARRWFRRAFPHRDPDFARLWNHACVKWFLGDVRLVSPKQTFISGWAVVPAADRPFVQFQVNGVRVEAAQFPVNRPDVAAQLRVVPDAADSGFHLFLDAEAVSIDLTIELHDTRTDQPFGRDYPPYRVPAPDRAGPLPAGNRIARVIGAPSDFYFRLGGYMAYHTLTEAVQTVTGQPITAFPRVLDWGCGCARVSRYFLEWQNITLTGADVDPDNIAWSQEHYPQAEWITLPLRPPSSLGTAAFDLAIGVSVFTHLKEPDQHAWLEELRRGIRPGGLALMTFHGDASIFWAGLSAERYAKLTRTGMADQANPLYDANLAESDYYRDTFHTREYIERVWSQYFEILAIQSCALAHQDFVIMQRRSG